ncbi:MAG: phage tail protein [Gammaproteobacteria bacterium]|nr:phage tail protein [Gammaproteobacteria bacterium]
MAEVMLSIGPYQLGVDTAALDTLSRVTEYRWAAPERIGASGRQQYMGPGKDTITVSGVILPHYRGGLGQLDAMRAEAGQGKPLIVFDHRELSTVYGKWCIVRISETRSRHLGAAPRRIEFSLEMAYYSAVGGAA